MPTKKQLEQKIEELKEENEFLKEKFEELEDFGCPDGELVFSDMYDKIEEWGIMEDTTPKFMEMWDIVKKHYENLTEENDKLKEQIEKLKKHYETDLFEWKGKHKSLQDMLDLYIEASRN